MKPAKRKDISKLTAEELNISPSLIDDIISYYYRTVCKKLSSGNSIVVRVPNLGNFVVKRKTLEEQIRKTEAGIKIIESMERESMKEFERKRDMKYNLDCLYNMRSLFIEEDEKKQIVKDKKQKYKDEKQSNSNLES